jgi:crotonobetainyl-CoA:carnitine CoA-transferase CaiB-like acyl-CoA transferase
LSGVTVLEVAQYFYVPSAAAILAEWGADVIKVESFSGDIQRRIMPSYRRDPTADSELEEISDQGFNPFFEQANRGKRSIGLALDTPEGREVLDALIRRSDAFVTNLLPHSRRSLQLQPADVWAVNDKLVYVRGSANGQRGPICDQGGYDSTSFWSRSGLANAATPPDSNQLHDIPTPALGDAVAGAVLAGGVAAALFKQAKTGKPSVVDTSLLGVGLWSNAAILSLSLATGRPWVAATVQDLSSARGNPLYGAYKTSDGRWLQLGMLRVDKWWAETCKRLGREDLIDDPRFRTASELVDNVEAAKEILTREFAKHSLADWIELLGDFRGPWSPVLNTLEVADDEQVTSNGHLAVLDGSSEHPQRLIRNAVEFDESLPPLRGAPVFAEHTDEILRELGLDDDAIVDLRNASAVI